MRAGLGKSSCGFCVETNRCDVVTSSRHRVTFAKECLDVAPGHSLNDISEAHRRQSARIHY